MALATVSNITREIATCSTIPLNYTANNQRPQCAELNVDSPQTFFEMFNRGRKRYYSAKFRVLRLDADTFRFVNERNETLAIDGDNDLMNGSKFVWLANVDGKSHRMKVKRC